jgi:hypothetical protein
MKKILILLLISVNVFAQNEDSTPYGGVWYNDVSNQRNYGAFILPRTDTVNIDTLTNVIKGDVRFDTLNSVVTYYNGTDWVNLIDDSLNDTIWIENGDSVYVMGKNVGIGTESPQFDFVVDGLSLIDTLSVIDYFQFSDLAPIGGEEKSDQVLTKYTDGVAHWAEVDAGTGWASYTDSTFTSGSPLSVVANDTVKIPMFWESSVTGQLPTGVDSLWSRADSTLIGFDGDAYTVRVSFNAESDNVSGYGKLIFDIGNGTPNVVSSRVFTFPKGANTEHSFSHTTALYAGSTFESNGCSVKLASGVGDMIVSDFNIMITRVHKAQ